MTSMTPWARTTRLPVQNKDKEGDKGADNNDHDNDKNDDETNAKHNGNQVRSRPHHMTCEQRTNVRASRSTARRHFMMYKKRWKQSEMYKNATAHTASPGCRWAAWGEGVVPSLQAQVVEFVHDFGGV